MIKLSTTFNEILYRSSRSIDLSEYEQCLDELQRMHNSKAMSGTALAILFFCIGLWALYEQAIVIAVLFFGLAADSNYGASLSVMQSNSMTTDRLFAMVINKQSQDIKSLRKEIRDIDCLPNA